MKAISVIVPARNEEALIGATVDAILAAAWAIKDAPGMGGGTRGDRALSCARAPRGEHLDDTPVEVIVVDNMSTDGTAAAVRDRGAQGVRIVQCERLKAPCARNFGAERAAGRILVFVDADTIVPPNALARVLELCDRGGYECGLFRLASLEGGARAFLWWTFWGFARSFPLPQAKGMPAFMFCSRAVFDEFGPFDEEIVIGEELCITGGLYAARPERFLYDREVTARSSDRRMSLRPFGYSRTFLRYLWSIVHPSGRVHHPDHLRHPGGVEPQ
jgi:glycosyltransferase involved in cell wall biosynthesis